MPIEKSYDPAVTEPKMYARWEKSGAFACDVKSSKEPYCIMLPPPNVTGSLHMGHALINTLQDILIRFQRMRGKDVLWQLGTDHAGIATQMVVERQLAAKGMNRHDMGREAFLKKVWEWKEESGGTITKQLRRLGASGDWSRERFTMDEGLSRAVTHEFVTLYREGLIYKDKRLVNWDPKMLTAVSDLEVEQKELRGNLWYLKYPIDGSDEFIVVATTRPETMLADVAVAVHPENENLKHLIGKMVKLPLTGRLIPIVADDYADPEKGTGAVKITPAHDFNDFEVWKRHKENPAIKAMPEGGLINLFDQHARLNDVAPQVYRGLERFEARKKIVADIEALELLEKIEPHTHMVPHGDRSGVPIEPWLSEQWYCDAKTLAQPCIKAVEEGRTQFVPKQWENTFFAWMRDIQPWCISRQLWWGHQIPAWYGLNEKNDDGKITETIFVAESEAAAIKMAQEHYGNKSTIKVVKNDIEALQHEASRVLAFEDAEKNNFAIYRDEDVFDTWFSSALWPFSTLGWPDKTPELARYYPTAVLMTGFDIIFFWVARMMMMGMHFVGDVPFHKVFISALVRDEKGQKMSKTKGNVIDPLDIIDKFSCDALRFTLANMSTPGRDIKLATSRIEGNRNFTTKLWNAARFCQMNECAWVEGFNPATVSHTVNKWIVSEVKLATDKIAAHLEEYRFDLASSSAYEFSWNNFCDWYLEFTKPILMNGSDAEKAETRATTAWVLGQMLHFLHPFMPYVTEELWEQFVGKGMLITAPWPDLSHVPVASTGINWVKELIETIRGVRVELSVPGSAKIRLIIKDASPEIVARIKENDLYITRMTRLMDDEPYVFSNEIPKGAAQIVFGDIVVAIPLAGVIDLDQERARLKKESERVIGEIRKIDGKMSNKAFVENAPPEIVEEQRERKAEFEAILAKLSAAQKSLAG